ncbi:MAG: cysteine desulfurase [Anaerofustis stercorihominis]|nr:cysteine desulfurase [Anaerofustis stercorihominis]
MNNIYLDNAATTRVYDEVIEYLASQYKDNYANPSSAHKFGSSAAAEVEKAEHVILDFYGLKNDDWKVIFTSGATESANLAIKGTLDKYDDISKAKIITTAIEHPCVSKVFEYCKSKGAEAVVINTDSFGRVDITALENAVDEKTKLVSIIFVNNETGIIQDIANIGKIIKKKNKSTLVHIDATQGYLEKLCCDDIDLISISAHKFHAPKGVGALIVRKNITLSAQMHGGGQQNAIRSGTVNSPLIGAMGVALDTLKKNDPRQYVKELQEYLYKQISDKFGEDVINSRIYEADYAPHILSMSFEGLNGSHILYNLEAVGIFVSTSSACSTHSKDKSVLENMGMTNKRAQGTIRVSLSEYNTKEEIDIFTEELSKVVTKLRKLYRVK